MADLPVAGMKRFTSTGGSDTSGIDSALGATGTGAFLGSAIPGIGTLLGAGLGFGSSLLGSLFGMFSNDANINMQRETNELNYQMWQEQLAAQREQYNLERDENRYLINQARKWSLQDRQYENEYNSSVAQMQRLKRAGLNPYLAMMGQNQIGSASASTSTGSNPSASVPSPVPASAPQVVNPFEGSGIQAAGQLLQSGLRDEFDMSAMRYKLDMESLETISRLQSSDVNNEFVRQQIQQILQDMDFNRESWQDRLDSIVRANEYQKAQTDLASANARYQDLINKFTPEQQKKLLREFDVKYDEIQSAIRKNDADAAVSVALKAIHEATKQGLDIDNQVKDSIADALVSKAMYEEEISYWHSLSSRSDAGESTESVGVSKHGISISKREGAPEASDRDSWRVRYDRKGKRYFWDNKNNRRIYVN